MLSGMRSRAACDRSAPGETEVVLVRLKAVAANGEAVYTCQL